MYRSWQGEVEVRDENTGEIIGKRHMCVEADDNVPVGCELGGPPPWKDSSWDDEGQRGGILFLLIIAAFLLAIIILPLIF